MSRYYDDDDDYRRSSSRSGGRHQRASSSQEELYSDSVGLPPAYMSTANGARLAYDPNTPVFPPPPNASNPDLGHADSLQVPSSRYRPRSQPPASSAGHSSSSRRDYDRSDRDYRDDRSSSSGDRSRDGSRSPLGKVKHAADKTFSTSTSGIGVGVLGAIVGGLAAHEASEAASRAHDKRGGRHHSSSHHHGNSSSKDHQRATLISTIVGAAVGGLGANAIEKRIEHRRQDRDREQKPRELEYNGSRGLISDRSDRSIRSSRSSRSSRGGGGGDDSDDGWESSHSRGRHNNRDRNLVISRSPSANGSRSRSNSRTNTSQVQRPQHGGSADAYYTSTR